MKDYSIYVTENIAKKAMEKGFECEDCGCGSFDTRKDAIDNSYIEGETFIIKHASNDWSVSNLPTAEQICGWLREEKNVEISIGRNELSDYPYKAIAYLKEKEDYAKVSIGYEYPNVLIEVINKALDLI